MTRKSCAWRLFSAVVTVSALGGTIFAQEKPVKSGAGGQTEMSLRKSVNSREFQGRQIEGEERQIGRGDSLWRILVEEKGLPGQKFRSYLVVIRGLNPQVKNLDVLRVGDKIFIPLRIEGPAEPAREQAQQKPGGTVDYRVKPGEHLYQILREQLKLTDERKVAQYYALVKDLNPERKDWDALVGGETIRLPGAGTGIPAAADVSNAPEKQTAAADAPRAATPKPATEIKPAAPPDARQALRAPAKENMALFTRIIEAIGNEIQQSGEEVVSLSEERIRFERSAYPVVYNPALRQKLVIDTDGKIPASLKSKLSDPRAGAQILPMANGVSIQDAVGQLLTRLGYQPLPADRPIEIQEEGIAVEAKGNWMALAPAVSNKTQDVLVINLTEQPAELPDYLKAELAKRGLQVREVALRSGAEQARASARETVKSGATQVKTWPREKPEIVDALLLAYGITFGVAENVSVELADGLRVDSRVDRIFELGGQRFALFFRALAPELRSSLQDRQGIKTIELDLRSLNNRDLIARLLTALGDPAAYSEHRFPAAAGTARDRVTVKAWGFQLNKRPLFLTDRQIPPSLHRFFFEKGLEIVYFQ